MFFITHVQELMCEEAAKHVPVPDFKRANGKARCIICDRHYDDHPQAVPHNWLTLLCDGKYVKL
jgi:hypothetical protein